MIRYKYLSWLHGLGVALSITALVNGGINNPTLGIPIVIGIVIAMEIPSSPIPTDRKILMMIHGSILKGGLKRGTFIREMFGLALAYSAIANFAFGMNITGSTSAFLAAALIISAVSRNLLPVQQ